MPFALAAHADEARRLANELRRAADLVDTLSRAAPTARTKGRSHPELRQVALRFGRINDILDKGVKAGTITPAQERSIARNLAGIAQLLEKGAGTSR